MIQVPQSRKFLKYKPKGHHHFGIQIHTNCINNPQKLCYEVFVSLLNLNTSGSFHLHFILNESVVFSFVDFILIEYNERILYLKIHIYGK